MHKKQSSPVILLGLLIVGMIGGTTNGIAKTPVFIGQDPIQFSDEDYPERLKNYIAEANADLPPRTRRSRVFTIKGETATGLNRQFGEPIMDLGQYNDYGYTTIGVLNPNGEQASPLTAESPLDALVATMVDPEFLSSHGLKSLAEIPKEMLNIPLRDVGMNSGFTGLEFKTRKPESEQEPYVLFESGQALPYYPITVKNWLSARGKIRFTCLGNGTSIVDAKFVNLIPHRMYTLWGFFDKAEEMPFDNFGPVRAFAGLPNTMLTTDAGVGRFLRVLNFCPTELKADEVPLSAIFLAYHSDIHATAAALSFTAYDRYPGNTRHVQLFFPVTQ